MRDSYDGDAGAGVDGRAARPSTGCATLEPRLRTDDLAIGCYEPGVGYCDPLFVASGLAEAAGAPGRDPALRLRACVDRARRRRLPHRARGGRADRSPRRASWPAGAWSNDLLAALGGAVPLDVAARAGRPLPRTGWRSAAPGRSSPDHVHELWMRPDGPTGTTWSAVAAAGRTTSSRRPRRAQRGADDERSPTSSASSPGAFRRRGRHLARLVVELLRLHARRQPGRRPRARPAGPVRRDGRLGTRLQARARAGPGGRRAALRWRRSELRLVRACASGASGEDRRDRCSPPAPARASALPGAAASCSRRSTGGR